MAGSNGLKPWKKNEILLEPEKISPEIQGFETQLSSKIIGQNRAIRNIVNTYKVCLAGLTAPGKPINNLLFLGPTGSGKTKTVEATAEILFSNPNAFIKIDCAEFQHSHEIPKLIGSPPGYLGHRETPPLLTQERIDQFHTEKLKLSFILFDEIEKASDALWQLLLGILDKATLTLGDNRQVNFSKCVIFMTSNLGGTKITDLISRDKIGFAPHKPITEVDDPNIDKKIYRAALETAKRKFTPEFMNRVDRVVVFRMLTRHHLKEILDIELNALQKRIMEIQQDKIFVINYTLEVKEFLLREGIDLKYGARHIKRAIERHIVYPLSNLITTGQIEFGNVVRVGFDAEKEKPIFYKTI